jgi:glutamate synthase (NADPH/NADH) small chain
MVYRVTSAHQEGGDRVFAVSTQRFTAGADGQVATLVLSEVDASFQPVTGTEREIPCQLALLAMGFTGPEQGPMVSDLELGLDSRGNAARDDEWMTAVPGVFVCGDMGRGQSLIVWAIAEGRSCAASVDRYLLGDTQLPAPIRPTDRAMV